MPTNAFTIAKLADAAGVGVEAVRYYQRGGLLAAPNRVDGGFRQYSDDDVLRLRFIKRAQALGYSLEDIAELMSLSATRDRLRVREITRKRVAEIRERMADLQSMASALENLADCCAKAPEGSACTIIAALSGSQDSDPTAADASLIAQAAGAGRRAFVQSGASAHRRTDEVTA
ncbi:MerR family transcriptional regulator [Thiomonas sp.]|uniref:MerR family transcriptional regulator n=1 Tax=Thiomonas sp. TaxID=2047785 RepID=UPI0025877516|nr:MerR family transcriptional regulator [Thiomonas sp.]